VRLRTACQVLASFALLFLHVSGAQQSRQIVTRGLTAAVARGQAKPVGVMQPSQRLNFSIVLPLRNQGQLTSLLRQLYDPSSPEYHHFLSVAEFTSQFGPTAADYQAVMDFARANGFSVTGSAANRLVIPVSGTVDQVQKAFNVAMKVYQHPTENRTFFSPDRQPSVALSVHIAHIAGLNNFSVPTPMVVKPEARRSLAVPAVLGSGPSSAYLPGDMRAAYYGGSALTGAGQTVALVQFDGYSIQDVASAFAGAASATTTVANSKYVLTYKPAASGATYNIPINNVLLDGATGMPGQLLPAADDSEEVIDIAQAVGMAPGLSEVRVYIGSSDATILGAIASENKARQVSISWSWTPDDPMVAEVFFEEFAAQGQSVFVASGDDGAYSPGTIQLLPGGGSLGNRGRRNQPRNQRRGRFVGFGILVGRQRRRR
jgi:subtilase family serine protease